MNARGFAEWIRKTFRNNATTINTAGSTEPLQVSPKVDDSVITLGNGTQSWDVKIFGNTTSDYLLWDASANGLSFNGSAGMTGTMPFGDDALLTFGGVTTMSWVTDDANANKFAVQLPTGGSVDVPVIVIGQGAGIIGDMGIHDGITEPTVCVIGIGAVATGPRFEFRKSRGTAAAPTVVTSADDIGQVDFYACVAANEWVRSAQILAECTGTVATTRGPGVLTFKTATDAAPSVLTNALQLNASQNATIGGGAASQSLTFDTSGTDVVLTASSAALAMGAITLNVTGTRFVQSYHTNLTSTNAVTVDSSETVKEDIAPYSGDALAVIDELDVITYKHDEWLDPERKTKLGIRAESVSEKLAIDPIDRGDGSFYPGVNTYALAAIQTKAIQQLLSENRQMKERLEKLEAANER